jgi:hypothetical protein
VYSISVEVGFREVVQVVEVFSIAIVEVGYNREEVQGVETVSLTIVEVVLSEEIV